MQGWELCSLATTCTNSQTPLPDTVSCSPSSKPKGVRRRVVRDTPVRKHRSTSQPRPRGACPRPPSRSTAQPVGALLRPVLYALAEQEARTYFSWKDSGISSNSRRLMEKPPNWKAPLAARGCRGNRQVISWDCRRPFRASLLGLLGPWKKTECCFEMLSTISLCKASALSRAAWAGASGEMRGWEMHLPVQQDATG